MKSGIIDMSFKLHSRERNRVTGRSNINGKEGYISVFNEKSLQPLTDYDIISVGVKIITGMDCLYGAAARGKQVTEIPGRIKPWR